jgi:hypothetical protein
MQRHEYEQLVREYMASDKFKMMLSEWTENGTNRNTRKETRQKVSRDLTVGPLLAEIVTDSIYMTSTRDVAYRLRGYREWAINIQSDGYSIRQIQDCLDYITYFVDLRVDTTTAWNIVLASRKKIPPDIFILDEESIPALLQLTKDQQTETEKIILEPTSPHRINEPEGKIKANLRALRIHFEEYGEYEQLVRDYMASENFKLMLDEWTENSTSRNTRKETRRTVSQDLTVGPLLTEIVTYSILMTSTRNEAYGYKEWAINIQTDPYFARQIQDCLDYITYCVDLQVDTRTAWNIVLASRKKLPTGILILDERSIPALLQLTKDQQTEVAKSRLEPASPHRANEPKEMKSMLRALRLITSEYGDNST